MGGGEGGGGEGGGCGGGCGGDMGGRSAIVLPCGRTQTSGSHATIRLLLQLPVQVNKNCQVDVAVYDAWLWLATKSVNRFLMEPQVLVQLMVSTVTNAPTLDAFTCSSTVYELKIVHDPPTISR